MFSTGSLNDQENTGGSGSSNISTNDRRPSPLSEYKLSSFAKYPLMDGEKSSTPSPASSNRRIEPKQVKPAFHVTAQQLNTSGSEHKETQTFKSLNSLSSFSSSPPSSSSPRRRSWWRDDWATQISQKPLKVPGFPVDNEEPYSPTKPSLQSISDHHRMTFSHQPQLASHTQIHYIKGGLPCDPAPAEPFRLAEYGEDALYTLVLLRHGESEWNHKNLYTGWCDVTLTERGRQEARDAGRLILENGIEIDHAFTSVLRRASFTTNMTLNTSKQHWGTY